MNSTILVGVTDSSVRSATLRTLPGGFRVVLGEDQLLLDFRHPETCMALAEALAVAGRKAQELAEAEAEETENGESNDDNTLGS